ncbi:hypothetical protein FisN_7Lh279 [Fistulifera solaris]|uniref:TLC domain-containing protein n=1 Tax=Fistulifera solaris TaxID=1519565 RepID=A0A1Z5JRA1_FISSO|nr:hypothetical protein FisN_7Lh279 [Fistulifera solaris]|eukprot:GAX16553.1 hypothetical protein FisN_7Lh279 [Fistulifera solaris]
MTSSGDLSGTEVTTPVGVTIAFRNHRQANLEESPAKPRSSHKKTSKRRSSLQQLGRERRKSVTLKRKIGTITKPVSSWTVFLEGASLYVASLFLPALLGALYQAYRGQWSFRNTQIYEYLLELLCPLDADNESTSKYLWSHWICKLELPREASAQSILEADIRLLSSRSSMYDDIWKVTFYAAGLALVRMLIVHLLVMPLQSTHQLLAMVRCKSIHLLSSDYSQTPVATPVKQKQNLVVDNAALASIQVPPLELPNNMASGNAYYFDHDESALGLQFDESERGIGGTLFGSSPYRQEDERILEATPGLTNQTDEEGYNSPDEPDNQLQPNNRLYSGPRYATAVFRLLYCTVTSVLALVYFRDADFWPWYVGGSGSTARCWDLSGGLIVSGMDADFDQRNTLLKQYFLWQASYHWHSGAFHVLSLLALLISPANKNAFRERHQFFDDLRSNTKAYARSLAIHILTLIIIALAYVFSSLRRLAAIGMFAFDVSSWFLHLLQVCINAPPNSLLQRYLPSTRFIHAYVVVPVFFAARLGIWPALAYSVLGPESKHWLQQLEKTLWPGSAFLLKTLLSIWHGLVFLMSVIYARRLIHLSHVKRGVATSAGF